MLYGTQVCIAMEELFKEAQAPEGLYTNLLISEEEVPHLVSDERIKGF
jgi:succinate-semialdehyde dehydrogenase/glutarate-semialdehyde dehydrogenase